MHLRAIVICKTELEIQLAVPCLGPCMLRTSSGVSFMWTYRPGSIKTQPLKASSDCKAAMNIVSKGALRDIFIQMGGPLEAVLIPSLMSRLFDFIGAWL